MKKQDKESNNQKNKLSSIAKSSMAIAILFIIVFGSIFLWVANILIKQGQKMDYFGLIFMVILFLPVAVIAVLLLKSGKNTNKRVQKFYDKYGEENLKDEINKRTIRRHLLPHNMGEVYFTDRFVIDLNQAVFPYQDIAKIKVSFNKKGWIDRYAALVFTLKNGEVISLCQDIRKDEFTRRNMLEYIEICKERNFKIEVDAKDLEVPLYMDKN